MSDDIPDTEFDPANLKVSKLRGVLFHRGIEFPSNAKKLQLVELYYKHLSNSSQDPVLIEGTFSGAESEENTHRKARRARKERSGHKFKHAHTEMEENSESLGGEPSPRNHENVSRKKWTRKPSRSIEKGQTLAKHEEIREHTGDLKNSEHDPDMKPTPKASESKKDMRIAEDAGKQSPKETIGGYSDVIRGGIKGKHKGAAFLKLPETTGYVSLRKRKSMLDEVDLKLATTPSKGNLFDIDSDLGSELLSLRRKRQKPASQSPKSPFQRHVNSPKLTLTKPSKNTPEHVSSPAAACSLLSSSSISEHQQPKPQNLAQNIIKDSTQNTLQISTPTLHRVSDLRPKVDMPILQEIVYEPPSTESSGFLSQRSEEPSIWFKTQQSFEENQGFDGPQKSPEDEAKPSASQSFDAALSKLRKETRSEDMLTLAETNAELAKLLNMDLSSIRPKAKGTRSITPKRPIVIPQRLLSRGSERSGKKDENKDIFSDDKDDENDEDESTQNTLDLSLPKAEREDEEYEDLAASENTTQLQRHIKRASVFLTLAYLVLWLGLVSTLLFAYWYREQTFLIGYCMTQIDRATIPNTPETSQWLVDFGAYLDLHFKPACIECPPHARCFPRLQLACYDDFVASTPWYYPYMPNYNLHAQKCVPDTKKAEKIEIMIDVVLDLLRARNANENCGRAEKSDFSAGLEVSELHDLLLALKAPYITEEEFEELWARSVVELEKEPEIIVGSTRHIHAPTDVDNDTVAEAHRAIKVLRSTSLSHVSLKCIMSNTVLSLALRFKKTVAVFALSCLFIFACYWKYQQHKLHTHKVETLYREVLSKLRKQAKLGQGSRELPENIGSVQLRDLILSDERNLAHKMRLWQAVSHKVDRNTNVKHELLEVHGEVMKMWQWISSVE